MTQNPSQYNATSAPLTEPVVVSDADHRFAEPAPVPPTFNSGASDAGNTSVKDTAKDEAGKVADTGAQAAKDVAGTAKDEAANVVAETKQQAKSLLESTLGELQSQGGAQQQRLASTLHSFAQELGAMASGSDQSGPLTDLVKQAAEKSGEIAHWLEGHEPADLLREVQGFARRRPVAFLSICGLAGVLAGRIARSATAANSSLDSGRSTSGSNYALGARPTPAATSDFYARPSTTAATSDSYARPSTTAGLDWDASETAVDTDLDGRPSDPAYPGNATRPGEVR